MERIFLEVNNQTANLWRNTSPKLREQIGKNIEKVLEYSLSKTGEANFELILQDARNEAAKNGLTEEILSICSAKRIKRLFIFMPETRLTHAYQADTFRSDITYSLSNRPGID